MWAVATLRAPGVRDRLARLRALGCRVEATPTRVVFTPDDGPPWTADTSALFHVALDSLCDRYGVRLAESAPPPDAVRPEALSRAQLEAELRRLRERLALAEQQRQEWEARARAAEAGAPVSEVRFDRLRRFLAREFHPDQASAEGFERTIRAEVL